MQSFVKVNHSLSDEITLLFTDIGKLCPYREFLTNMSFNAIRENKIRAKISNYTLSPTSHDLILPSTLSSAYFLNRTEQNISFLTIWT